MTKIVSSFGAGAISLFILLQAGLAQAQSARTWVSGTGSGSACTRAAPCATFAAAYAATSPGGEIDVLDGGEFGQLNIGHAITIANDGAGTAAITPSSGGALPIAAGLNDAVVLRGLTLNGVNSSSPGIDFASGASLLVEHCEIQGFQSRPGIAFAPTNAAKLWVADSVLSSDGLSSGASVFILPTSGAAATVHLERVQILQAIGNGIRVDGTTGGGDIDVELDNVTVDGATGSGIVAVSATSGGPAVNIMADQITSSHNIGFGVRAVGGTASIAISRSTVTGNTRGIGASSGGVLASYSDNRIKDNVAGNGDPTSTLSPK